MKWMIAAILAVVLGFPIAFTAGVVVSLSVSAEKNPAGTLRSVMGSAGDWVSGLGALAAAVIAVYLADKQRRDNSVKMDINQYYNSDAFVIDLISSGEKGAVVRGIFIRDVRLKKQIMISRPPFVDSKILPKRFDYGDVERITIDRNWFVKVQIEIAQGIPYSDYKHLALVVGTSTSEFRQALNAEFASALSKHQLPTA
ncbi:hypothetical protein CH92_09565 [Stutzerimonas stutzeri]|uniref:Uncharacterized protein n=1 Tax=Stutzerimonas stutzeri TaxID=316 RepID=W8R4R8_STUST|nr:hypothetical protein [Stutzerimonas stutzeri]AHL77629.1 hypothetical protein CH92_09565 [Stutzerimonas stutzeri]MCQ4328099.1 hypothetical protein [Stutzerimonas stutzeri]